MPHNKKVMCLNLSAQSWGLFAFLEVSIFSLWLHVFSPGTMVPFPQSKEMHVSLTGEWYECHYEWLSVQGTNPNPKVDKLKKMDRWLDRQCCPDSTRTQDENASTVSVSEYSGHFPVAQELCWSAVNFGDVTNKLWKYILSFCPAGVLLCTGSICPLLLLPASYILLMDLKKRGRGDTPFLVAYAHFYWLCVKVFGYFCLILVLHKSVLWVYLWILQMFKMKCQI